MADYQSGFGDPHTALSVPGQQVLVDSGSRSNWSDLDGDQVRRRNTSTTNFSTLMHGLRRHWMLGLVSAILFSGAVAAGAWFWFAPEFVAFAILRVAGQEPRLIFPTPENQRSDFEIYKRTQKELMRSRFVLNAALRSPDIERLPAVREQEDAVTWLEKRVYVDFPGDAEIMRITFNHTNAETAAAIANAVTKAYMREVVDVERRHRMDRLTSLEKVFNDTEDKMRAKQTDLKHLADKLGTGDGNALSSKQQITLQHFATLRNEHTKIQFELMRSKLTLAAFEEETKGAVPAAPGDPDDELVEDYVSRAPDLIALKSKIEQLRRLIEHDESVMANPHHPRLEKQREDLTQAEQELVEKHDKVRDRVRKELVRTGFKPGGSGLGSMRHQVAVLEAQEKQMNEEVEKFAKEAESIGRSSIDVEMMRSDLKQIEKLGTDLGKELESLRVELRSPSRVIELQAADVPRTRDTVGRIRTTSIVALLGFLLPFLAVSLWDARSQRVNTTHEIAEGLGMRIVGALPALPAHAHKLSRTGQPLVPRLQYMLRESFDTLRTTLIRGVDGQSHRLVLVTSALSGEGKTTLATQLAFSFARSGRRTLLVDCDLRRPAVHRVFGLPREGGMGDVLRSEVPLTDAIRATLTPNLWVLPAGRCDQQALSALAQRQMFLGECFQKMRDDFEFVIIDCCPVLPVVDSMLIGQHVDIAVLSVLRDVSQVPRVDEANRRLTSMGIRVFGAVVTGAVGGHYYHQEYHEELSV